MDNILFVRSGNGEQCFPGLSSFSIYSCFSLFFLLFFSAVNCYFLVSYSAMYLFFNFPAQWTSIGRGNRRWRQRLNLSSLESLFSLSALIKVLETKENNWWRFLIFLPQELHSRSDLSSQYFTGKPTLSHSFARITLKGPSALRTETSSRFQYDGPEIQIWL